MSEEPRPSLYQHSVKCWKGDIWKLKLNLRVGISLQWLQWFYNIYLFILLLRCVLKKFLKNVIFIINSLECFLLKKISCHGTYTWTWLFFNHNFQTKYHLPFHFPQIINRYKTIKLLHINTFNLHTYTHMKIFPFCSGIIIININNNKYK